jgi:hypothetical protein
MSVLWDREGITRKNLDMNFVKLMKELIGMF